MGLAATGVGLPVAAALAVGSMLMGGGDDDKEDKDKILLGGLVCQSYIPEILEPFEILTKVSFIPTCTLFL